MNKKEYNILIVDDEPTNLSLLAHILNQHYTLMFAPNGETALRLAQERMPELILLDIMMPDIDGLEVCKRLKANSETNLIPVIFLTTLGESTDEKIGLQAGAIDYIHKPFNPAILLQRISNYLTLADHQKACELEVKRKTLQLENAAIEQLLALIRAARFKDHETANHTLRVGVISWMLAQKLNWTVAKSFLLFLSAPLHDIGKIGVPDEIMLSPLNLRTEKPEWWEEMQRHTEYGAEIVGKNLESPLMKMVANVALYHHEKCDGSGYPNQVSGNNIPKEAMITAVADMVDAMLDPSRPYRSGPMDEEKIKSILQHEKSKTLDAKIVEAALSNWPLIQRIEKLFPNNTPVPFESFARLTAENFSQKMRECLGIE